jgi:hypothetical protein
MTKVPFATQADYAERAYQASQALMATEAQKINQSGDTITIDPNRHYIIFCGAGEDPEHAVTLDLANHAIYNLTVVPPS